jgi:ERCC4-related helicase
MKKEGITDYHAKYFAYELTKRSPSDSIEKLSSSLSNAQVDLNPHQIEAALFAFKSPLSKGAILADEVGLGKTIEAGLVLSQKWAEKKRNILLIVPSNLRKQWSQELIDKFFLPSFIMETKSFNTAIKAGNLNPFQQEDKIIITSYHFARAKSPYLKQTPWDLVVIDEAHRLRNVYKPSNKIARELKDALANFPKILLTATPLQNSLLELFGLVSFIDDHVFGDLDSFKANYAKVSQEQPETESDGDLGLVVPRQTMFADLRARLKPICMRTLRRQVLEYIKFTNRIPLTQDYSPTEQELKLYESMSEYLQQPKLYALPNSQRQLVTLVLRKLLASSSYAIASTLGNIVFRLEKLIEETKKKSAIADLGLEGLQENFEGMEQMEDEWLDDEEEDEENGGKQTSFTAEDIPLMEAEVEDLRKIQGLANQVFENSKANALLQALDKGFQMTTETGAKRKAMIFTESTVTQRYLKEHLSKHGYEGKIVLFNGSNNDDESKAIYVRWLEKHKDTDRITGSKTADLRAALVDEFRDTAEIMIATEAAAEGVNLQFCSLLVNFDLPWNPQRIEQRIGRCHRYGQKHDVVVLNFINRKNAADQRVYELLDQKFNLFKGVFGASDEVLGTIESGMDFEKRIAAIYQDCRTEEEINTSFDKLQGEMEVTIAENMKDTRQKLLENFDTEVHERLRINKELSEISLDAYERWLWLTTKHYLGDHAEFAEHEYTFRLRDNPFPEEPIDPGPYKIGKNVEDSHIYRPGHPLAQRILEKVKTKELPSTEVCFDYDGDERVISALEPFCGKSGVLRISNLSIESFEAEDHVIATAVTDDGEEIPEDIVKRMFTLNAEVTDGAQNNDTQKLVEIDGGKQNIILGRVLERNNKFFDEELEKLDKWSEDRKKSLELELRQLDIEIKTRKTQSKKIGELETKVAEIRAIKDLERKRTEKRQKLYEAQDDVDKQKDELLERIEAQLKQKTAINVLFTTRFRIV